MASEQTKYSETLIKQSRWGLAKFVRYMEGLLFRKPRYDEFEGKRPKCSLYQGYS